MDQQQEAIQQSQEEAQPSRNLVFNGVKLPPNFRSLPFQTQQWILQRISSATSIDERIAHEQAKGKVIQDILQSDVKRATAPDARLEKVFNRTIGRG